MNWNKWLSLTLVCKIPTESTYHPKTETRDYFLNFLTQLVWLFFSGKKIVKYLLNDLKVLFALIDLKCESTKLGGGECWIKGKRYSVKKRIYYFWHWNQHVEFCIQAHCLYSIV